MKKLILVRHAAYEGGGPNPSLSDLGRSQAKALGQKLKTILGDEPVEIWTSSAARAYMTAVYLADAFGQDSVDVNTEEKLWADNWHPHDFKWLKQQIDCFQGDNLIIVSHLEYVEDFPRELKCPPNSSGYAQGVVIENGKVTLI